MSPAIGSQECPKSLLNLIAEAKAAVESWPENGDDSTTDEDGLFESTKAWAVRLSQGEYEADLFWECMAQDCEQAGNWEDAKAAYQKILSLKPESLKQFAALSSLAGLCSILGEHNQALAYYHAASANEQTKNSSVLYRMCLANEASQLLRMGRIRAARKLSKRGLATLEAENCDYLNLALLKMVITACDLEQRQLVKAGELLSETWSVLEVLRAGMEQCGTEIGSGLLSAYSQWWRLEAKRRRFTGQGSLEIEALETSLNEARRGAAGWNRLGWDVSIVSALEALADACQRFGRDDECIKARVEAGKIRDRWHLPHKNETPEQSTYLNEVWKLLFG